MASFFDSLTGAPVHDAQDKSRAYLGTLQTNLIGASNDAYGGASNILRDAYGNARTDMGQGYDTATGAIRSGVTNAQGFLDQGASGAVGALTQNGGAYTPLSELASRYGLGAGLYSDALGINGAEGNARATAAYTAAPGYTEGLNSGIDALNRRYNAGGMLQGGNANRDAIKFGIDYNNQQGYGKWMDRLAGFNPLELSATSGAATGNAGINQSVAGIYDAQGRNKANIASGEGMSLSQIATDYYNRMGGLGVQGGTALANNGIEGVKNAQAVGLNIAPQYTGTYQKDADADMAASKNQLGLAMQLGTLAAGGIGGISGAFPGASFGMPGGSLGLGGIRDASMWNTSLPKNWGAP